VRLGQEGVEHQDVVTVDRQPVGDVGADETGTARDQDAHGVKARCADVGAAAVCASRSRSVRVIRS
jgi:hypothetical protein